MCSAPDDSGEGEDKYPSVYIDWVEDLPKLSAGQTVMLKGVIKEFTETDSADEENPRKCRIEVTEMTPQGSVKAPTSNSDEDDIEKGLKDAETAPKGDEEEE